MIFPQFLYQYFIKSQIPQTRTLTGAVYVCRVVRTALNFYFWNIKGCEDLKNEICLRLMVIKTQLGARCSLCW